MHSLRALITGAAQGLGKELAKGLTSTGGKVALVDIDDSVTQGPGHTFVGDVTDESFVSRMVPDAAKRLQGLDVVVNNAAVGGPVLDLVETPVPELSRVLEVNLFGAMLVARAAAGLMREAGAGCIINIGSIFGLRGAPGCAGYSASKGGLHVLTQSLAIELAPFGIRVNAIAPGNMATEMHWQDLRERAAQAGRSFEAEVERVRQQIPLGRHGTGNDLAGAVQWLASESASYVTGQTIVVDGGATLV